MSGLRRRTALAAARLCLGLAACLPCAAVQAQTLDDIDVRSQSDAKVVRIRFNASVRFVSLAPSTAADLYTLHFEILAGEDAVQRQGIEEFRRLPAGDGLPALTVGYAPAPGSQGQQLTIRVSPAQLLQARQGSNARSIELLLPMPGTATAPLPAAPPASTTVTASEAAAPEVEAEAGPLMVRAREALAARQADAAVALLNQLLKLPPNSQSMPAQELIGNAWELADSGARARVEYELYLRLYPQGEGAGRVAQRLAALGGALPAPAEASATAQAPAALAPGFKPWSGSIAQYYYGGKARNKSLVNIAVGVDQATISRTTESAIVTSADLGARYVGENSETRGVIRGSTSSNLLSGSHSSSSIGAVYAEHRRNGGVLDGMAVRVGRQSPISGGLLGLFDGVSLAYPLSSGVKLDVMGGVPASTLVSAPSERLFAAVVEADTILERWGGNFYVLDQSTQGITNRRALGTELRYAGEQWSLNAVLDYDGVFNKLDAVSLHGSFQAPQQTTITLLFDERRAPSLQLTNALISSGAASLKEMLQQYTLDEVRAKALNTSAIARQFLVSVVRPLNPRWQFSTDLRYSAVGALPAVGDFEATQATGGQYSLSAQLTGTNLYSARDINNFNFSVMKTPSFKGVQFAYNNLSAMPGYPDLTIEPSIRIYSQSNTQDEKLLRVGPGVRLSYRASSRASLLGELLYEASRNDGPINHDSSNSVFFYVGYRYELF